MLEGAYKHLTLNLYPPSLHTTHTMWPQWPGFTQQPGEGCFTPPPGICWWSAPRVPPELGGGFKIRLAPAPCKGTENENAGFQSQLGLWAHGWVARVPTSRPQHGSCVLTSTPWGKNGPKQPVGVHATGAIILQYLLNAWEWAKMDATPQICH